MASLYLSRIRGEERAVLERRLWDSQKGSCFICEREIDLDLHANSIDIDHVEPIKIGGKDEPSNFALTHSSCNRSKQASDLRVARILEQFQNIKALCEESGRTTNLSDILQNRGGASHPLPLRIEKDNVKFSLPNTSNNQVLESPLYVDELSGLKYFFAKLPITYLFHDDRINPRPIGGSLSKLVQEFFKQRPQLHVALGWVSSEEGNGHQKVKFLMDNTKPPRKYCSVSKKYLCACSWIRISTCF